MMVRGILSVVLVGGALFGAPHLDSLGPVLSALLAVAAGALLATVPLGAASPAAVALGAVGALAHTALAPLSVALAGGALFAFVFAARAVRARSLLGGSFAFGLGVAGGALGTSIAVSYAGAPPTVRAAGIVVGALVACVPLLVPVDDPVAWSLRELSQRASGVLRLRLLRAVVLRRRHGEVATAVSRTTRRRMERAWFSLLGAARARVRARGNAHEALDLRVAAYVQSLGRATRAAAGAKVLSADLDDLVLTELRLERDDLEARAGALAEVGSQAA